jgi:hypothetical protein
MNVEPVVQPKAALHCFGGGALRGRNEPAEEGGGRRRHN